MLCIFVKQCLKQVRINWSTTNSSLHDAVYPQSDPTCSIVVIWVKLLKTEKTIEIHLVRPTEVCGKVLSDTNVYKSVKTSLLLSIVIDADHQNSCLFTNKGHFSSPLSVLIGVLAKFYE